MKRYFFMVIVAAIVAAGIYAVVDDFIPAGFEPFVLFVYFGAWILGFMRWLGAVIEDERDPLGFTKKQR